jgi:hypothetical protein
VWRRVSAVVGIVGRCGSRAGVCEWLDRRVRVYLCGGSCLDVFLIVVVAASILRLHYRRAGLYFVLGDQRSVYLSVGYTGD